MAVFPTWLVGLGLILVAQPACTGEGDESGLSRLDASDTRADMAADSSDTADTADDITADTGDNTSGDAADNVGDDGNNRVTEAPVLALEEASVDWLWPIHDLPPEGGIAGRLDPAENPTDTFDTDYYAVDLTEGTWLVVVVAANEADVEFEVDPAVWVIGTDGDIAAYSNYAVDSFRGGVFGPPDFSQQRLYWGTVHLDPELIFRAPMDGRYVIGVADWTGVLGADPANRPGNYRLLVGTLSENTDGVVVDPEAGDDTSAAVDLGAAQGPLLILGTIRDADDLDFFSWTAPEDGILHCQLAMAFETMFGEDFVNTSGGASVELWLTRPPSSEVLAHLDGTYVLAPSVDAGQHTLIVGGADPGFYVLKLAQVEEQVRETTDWSRTEPFFIDRPELYSMTFFLEHSDEDAVSFEVEEDGEIPGPLRCYSATESSGLIGVWAQLVRPDGTQMGRLEEDERALSMGGVPLPAGIYTVVFGRIAQLNDVAGNWVHCYFRL